MNEKTGLYPFYRAVVSAVFRAPVKSGNFRVLRGGGGKLGDFTQKLGKMAKFSRSRQRR